MAHIFVVQRPTAECSLLRVSVNRGCFQKAKGSSKEVSGSFWIDIRHG